MTISDLHLECRQEEAALHKRIADLEQQLADLRAACEQKQEIINSFDLVDKARREENYKLEQQLAELREAAQDYYECQDLVSWVQDVEGIKQAAEKALLVALKEQGK